MIYTDLLVIEDLILNYVILLATGTLLSRVTKFEKVFLSSVVGTIPLIFLFTTLSQIIIFTISIFFSFIMSVITFRYNDIVYTIKNIIYMYFVSVFLAGSIYLINTNLLPNMNNYLLNVIILIFISPVVTYFYVKSINNIKTNYSNYYKVDIYLKDKPKITVNSFLDTGNVLSDPYNHKPVILVDKNVIVLSNEKIILVPYHTIDNYDMLKCFSPEKIYVHNVGYRKRVLIGLIDEVNIEGADCILNKKILERI